MALRSRFKLGRPGKEMLFDVNPREMNDITARSYTAERGLDGTLNEATTSRYRPMMRLSSRFMSPGHWNRLKSLLAIEDTPLIFEPMDISGEQVYESWQEKIYPDDPYTLVLPDNSLLRASALRVAAGGNPAVTITGVYRQQSAEGSAGLIALPTVRIPVETIYSQDFELLANGPLEGQDLWVKLFASLSSLQVTDSGLYVISGTKSVYSLISPANYFQYRRVLPVPISFDHDFNFGLRVRQPGLGNIGSVGSILLAKGDPLVLTGSPSVPPSMPVDGFSWKVRWINAPYTTKYRLHFSGTNPTFSSPFFLMDDNDQTHNVKISVVKNVADFTVDGSTVYSHSVRSAPASDRIMVELDVSTHPWVIDNFLLQRTQDAFVYNDSTRTITLGAALPDLSPVFVSYRTPCVAVRIRQVPASIKAGMVNMMSGELDMVGA